MGKVRGVWWQLAGSWRTFSAAMCPPAPSRPPRVRPNAGPPDTVRAGPRALPGTGRPDGLAAPPAPCPPRPADPRRLPAHPKTPPGRQDGAPALVVPGSPGPLPRRPAPETVGPAPGVDRGLLERRRRRLAPGRLAGARRPAAAGRGGGGGRHVRAAPVPRPALHLPARLGHARRVGAGWWLWWPATAHGGATRPALPFAPSHHHARPPPRPPTTTPAHHLPTFNNAAAPDTPQINAALAFAAAQRAAGVPVLVHCAHGHGRSNVVTVAWLLRSGAAVGVDAALAAVQASRPRAKLNARQRRAVDAWWAAERGGKKAE